MKTAIVVAGVIDDGGYELKKVVTTFIECPYLTIEELSIRSIPDPVVAEPSKAEFEPLQPPVVDKEEADPISYLVPYASSEEVL